MDFYHHKQSDFVDEIGEQRRIMSVYALATSDLEFVKIGMTGDPKQRMRTIQSACPFPLTWWLSINTPIARSVEQDIHRVFCSCWVRGEWFSPGEKESEMMISYFRETAKLIGEAYRDFLGAAHPVRPDITKNGGRP